MISGRTLLQPSIGERQRGYEGRSVRINSTSDLLLDARAVYRYYQNRVANRMHMTLAEYEQLNEDSLLSFLERKIPEGQHIDYKRSVDPSKSEQKTEFVKDIIGFANADGGLIVFGADEPDDNLPVTSQLVGIVHGDDVCNRLERVASDLSDPRLPGFRIKPIGLSSGTYAIVAYIPTSAQKPHMVSKQRFHRRHNESTLVMSSAEVKAMVVENYDRAKYIQSTVNQTTENFLNNFLGDTPAFIFQATPLVALKNKMNVLSGEYNNILAGVERSRKFHNACSFYSGPAPIPGIEMLRTRNSYESTKVYLQAEIHTDGRIVVCQHNIDGVGGNEPNFASYKNQLFCAFGHMVDEVLAVSGESVPYVINCSYVNTAGTKLYLQQHGEGSGSFVEPVYPLPTNIRWPETVVQVGESAESKCSRMGEVFYHAFGCQAPDNLPSVRGH